MWGWHMWLGSRNCNACRLRVRPITDAGLRRITGLSQLRSLRLEGSLITDAGLGYIARLSRLRELWLIDDRTTDGAVEKLKNLLPDCEITHYSHR